MREKLFDAIGNRWTQPSYERRVRGDTPPIYLWGSAGITQGIAFDKPLILHIRNDLFGQPISLSTVASSSATPVVVGRLQPGECISIQLQNISGVFASCVPDSDPLESMVACIIKE
jgi:hypothetical protein